MSVGAGKVGGKGCEMWSNPIESVPTSYCRVPYMSFKCKGCGF